MPKAEHMVDDAEVMAEFDEWVAAFERHVTAKGKIPPGEYRAFGYDPPPHFAADLRTKWRGLRALMGAPAPETSVAIKQERGLSREDSVFYKRSEGAKLRK